MHLWGSLGNLLTRCFLFITQPAVVPNEPKGNLSFSYIHGSCATGGISSAHRVRTSHQKMKFVATSLPTFFLSVTEAEEKKLGGPLKKKTFLSRFGNTSFDYFALDVRWPSQEHAKWQTTNMDSTTKIHVLQIEKTIKNTTHLCFLSLQHVLLPVFSLFAFVKTTHTRILSRCHMLSFQGHHMYPRCNFVTMLLSADTNNANKYFQHHHWQ